MIAKVTDKKSQYYGRSFPVVDEQRSIAGKKIYLLRIHSMKVESFYYYEVLLQDESKKGGDDLEDMENAIKDEVEVYCDANSITLSDEQENSVVGNILDYFTQNMGLSDVSDIDPERLAEAVNRFVSEVQD